MFVGPILNAIRSAISKFKEHKIELIPARDNMICTHMAAQKLLRPDAPQRNASLPKARVAYPASYPTAYPTSYPPSYAQSSPRQVSPPGYFSTSRTTSLHHSNPPHTSTHEGMRVPNLFQQQQREDRQLYPQSFAQPPNINTSSYLDHTIHTSTPIYASASGPAYSAHPHYRPENMQHNNNRYL